MCGAPKAMGQTDKTPDKVNWQSCPEPAIQPFSTAIHMLERSARESRLARLRSVKAAKRHVALAATARLRRGNFHEK